MTTEKKIKWHDDDDIHIPEVLIEKILLNLPIKSLMRFCCVSKSWNRMILGSGFAKRYRGREMIVLRRGYCYSDDRSALVCPLSHFSSDRPMDRATPFAFARPAFPFKAADSYAAASCGHLWCVEFGNSLVLYNPSIQTYRKLPTPSARVPVGTKHRSTPVYVYGLGYDCAADDYRLLKIHREQYVEAELYSLKSDSWRIVESRPPSRMTFLSSKCEFAGGKLCWWVEITRFDDAKGKDLYHNVILSFDLSTGEYQELKMPKHAQPQPREKRPSPHWHMAVFGGRLRVCLTYGSHTRFAVWVLDHNNYWTKELELRYGHIVPLCYSYLKPFYFYDTAGNLVKAVVSSMDMRKIFVCRDQDQDGSTSTLVDKSFGSNGGGCGMFDTYVESFAMLN